MNINLEKDETIDSLEINEYKIIQRKNYFKFGIDSVILANVANEYFEKTYKENKKYIICDLCAGSGVIGLIFYAKHLIKHNKEIEKNIKLIFIEIEEKMISSIKKSIIINGFEKNFFCINEDIKNIGKIKFSEKNEDLKNFIDIKQLVSKRNLSETIDVLLVNPPYFKNEKGLANENKKLGSARSEKECSFEDVAKVTSFLLKNKGSAYIIHKTERLAEIITTLKKYKLEPKEIIFIHSFVDKESQNFIIVATKNGKEGIKVQRPIIIYEKENTYTEQLLTYFNSKKNKNLIL